MVEHVFSAMMLQLDAGAGDIIDALKEKGMWENTVFIFTSDVSIHLMYCVIQT